MKSLKLKESEIPKYNDVNYILYEDDKLIKDIQHVCFSGLKYLTDSEYKYNRIIFKIKYTSCPFNKKEIEKWLNDMVNWKFPVQLIEYDKSKETFEIEIKLTKSEHKNKFIFVFSTLVLLRYLQENNLYYIPQYYFYYIKELKIKDDDYDSKFKLMQLVHFHTKGTGANSGHSLFEYFSVREYPITISKLHEKIKTQSLKDGYLNGLWESKDGGKIITDKKDIIKSMNNNKQNNIKLYVVGGDTNYTNWLPFDFDISNELEKSDFVLFTGGEDVSPDLYGEPKGKHTYCNPRRDKYEIEIYNKAKSMNLPMLGICRGAQFLGVMNGAKLVQHQQNSSMHHPITLSNGKEIYISSTHHQAVYPYNLFFLDYNILGYSKNLSSYHLDGNEKEMNPDVEVEIIAFPATKCLCIQGHPEYSSFQNQYPESLKEVQKLTKEFFNL